MSELLADPAELDRLLARGAEKATSLAEPVLAEAYEAIGFSPRA
jgi:tryptophanyl-tRNA synthetase